ncbi:hypothetical protein QJS10_CPB19g00490 [Acorus calamus]|uniref:Uncharacterized protein n=1 Tax=Acorus calamus TaxID=4465 RepID=A0AAV9CGW2_ACOCL|nr:hypothetical protein QJS10_CPB19g00490 [Acorus calamus]
MKEEYSHLKKRWSTSSVSLEQRVQVVDCSLLSVSLESVASPPVIIGGMVMDIHAKPSAALKPGTTTPGKEKSFWSTGNLQDFLQKVTSFSPNVHELISMANALSENNPHLISNVDFSERKHSIESSFQMLKPAISLLLEKASNGLL